MHDPNLCFFLILQRTRDDKNVTAAAESGDTSEF